MLRSISLAVNASAGIGDASESADNTISSDDVAAAIETNLCSVIPDTGGGRAVFEHHFSFRECVQ